MAKIDKKENHTVHFSVDINADDFEKAVQKVYLANRSKIMVPGFRKGKVPRRIIEMHYGNDIFYEEALNEMLPDIYEKAIEELELEVIDQPEVDLPDEIKKGESFVATFTVDVKPEVELPGFDELEVEDLRYELKDEHIESEIEAALNQNARMVGITDRAVQDDDLVNITYEGKVDGELFEGGADEDVDLHIGSETFIPGFEEGLIGKNVGDEVDLELTFPEEYHAEDLAGKPVVFHVKINGISKRELPEFDDEFVKDVSEFDTVDEYREDIRKRLAEDLKERETRDRENLVINRYAELVDVEIPEAMIENQIKDEINHMAVQLGQSGLSMDQYMQFTNSTVDMLKEQFRPGAEVQVKNQLILDAIVKQEQFEISEAELDEEIQRIVDVYGGDDEERKKAFVEELKEGEAPMLKQGLQKKKAIEFLMDKAHFVEKKDEEPATEEKVDDEIEKDEPETSEEK